jgi:hypothetical protein
MVTYVHVKVNLYRSILTLGWVKWGRGRGRVDIWQENSLDMLLH